MAFKFDSSSFRELFFKVLNICDIAKSEYVENIQLKEKIDNLDTVKIVLESVGNKYFDQNIIFSNNNPHYNFLTLIDTKIEIFENNKNQSQLLDILDLTLNLFYIYFSELLFNVENLQVSLSLDIHEIIFFVEKEYKEHREYSKYISFVDRELPFQVFKCLVHSANLKSLADLISTTNNVTNLLESWEENFDKRKNDVIELEKRLESNKQTYDFVLLNEGFKNLYNQKKEDLKSPESNYKWLFRFILAIPTLEIIFFGLIIANEIEINSVAIWYMVVPSISLILFLFYFYRINLQEIRSIKSQMMQLELRMALCQFIHTYAEDSEKLHQKNTAGFEKFENIIFSPLVSSDDKIPTTFDGMEQLANLVSQFRNK